MFAVVIVQPAVLVVDWIRLWQLDYPLNVILIG